MAKLFLCLIFLCGFATIAASEVHYIIRPSQSQSNCADRCNSTSAAACVDNELTLAQFVNNSSHYLTSDTSLIFSPRNYSLESELVVENVHSFSMSAWPTPSSKAVITCGHNARFKLKNVSIVTVSGLEFVGCFENHVLSVDQFQLKNSAFFGNGEAIVNGTVLSIEESTASLDRVAFVSVIDKPLDIPVQQVLDLLTYPVNCTELAQIFSTMDRSQAIGISLMRSSISVIQSWFEGINVGLFGGVIYDEFGSNITIVNTTFMNNSASDLYAEYTYRCYHDCSNITSGIVYANGHGNTVKIYDSKFIHNVGVVLIGQNGNNMLITRAIFINNKYQGYFASVYVTHTNLTISHSTFTNNTDSILNTINTSVSISHSEFSFNKGGLYTYGGVITSIDHSKFVNNTGSLLDASNTDVSISHSEFFYNEGGLSTHGGVITSINHSKFINNTGSVILDASNVSMISVTHSEFVDNIATHVHFSVLDLDGVMITVSLSEFINNTADTAVVHMQYFTSGENLTDNVFRDNSAAYEIFISPFCGRGFYPSLRSSRCIPCSDNWRRDLIGIVVAAFIAGIALVIFMLALNMTVAVGTLNGILFYANIVAVNVNPYFLPFKTPGFVTVFISWLNLDIGFDVCLFGPNISEILLILFKPLLQIAFPAYVIVLVIIVIVTSKYSSKFAKIVGKGNPVAVLATMILLSYTKFLNTTFASLPLLYGAPPAYGSRNFDVSRVGTGQLPQAIAYSLAPIFLVLCVTFAALIFSWQWLLQYQDKAIFKWMRYQKLRHFLEPYHAPCTAKYRYWIGLLLFVRVLLYIILALNFLLIHVWILWL